MMAENCDGLAPIRWLTAGVYLQGHSDAQVRRVMQVIVCKVSNAYLYFEFEEYLYVPGSETNLSAGKPEFGTRG